MKKYIVLLLVLVLITGCQSQPVELEPEEVEEVVEVIEESRILTYEKGVKELSFVESGERIDDFKLGFLPPDEFDEDGFEGWLLIYSKDDIDTVWQEAKELSKADILLKSNINGMNRIYKIENYEWADGLGNTMNAGQKDFMTGMPLGLGEYHFYVVTQGSDGIIGISEVADIVDMKPQPIHVKYKEGSVAFESMDDDRIIGNFVFYSELGPIFIEEKMMAMSLNDIQAMAENKSGVYSENLEGEISLLDMKTVDGQDLDELNYFVYVAAMGEGGVLGITSAGEMMVNKALEEIKTELINDGKGTVILSGGGSASKGDKHADFFNLMREKTGLEKPRLAMFSSSRADAATVYNHFYYDDPISGALVNNYEYHGFESVFIPLAIDNRKAIQDDPYFISLVKSSDVVFLQGGDQNKHIKSLYREDGSPSGLLEAIWYVYERGGVIAGTSAGMAAMGEYSYGSGYSDVALENVIEQIELKDIPEVDYYQGAIDDNNVSLKGLGILEEDIVCDTHFDYRGRLGRLLTAMRDLDKRYGIGSDEGTALSITDGIGQVVGHQGVFIVDATNAIYEESGYYGSEGLRLHYLTSGDQFDFNTGKADLKGNDADKVLDPENPSDVFSGKYALTKALNTFALSVEDTVDWKVATTSKLALYVTADKADDFFVKVNGEYSDDLLEDYDRVSVTGLNLRVGIKEVDLSSDELSPEITYMKSYEKSYNVYLGIVEEGSGLDLSSINYETVIFESETNTLYEEPYYDEPYKELKVSISEDNFIAGDRVTINGVKDLSGNVVVLQTWVYDGSKWNRD